MSVNASSIFSPLVYHCSTFSSYIAISFAAVKVIFVFPLSTFVLCLGYQRWRQQRSFNKANHSDVFAHHMAAMELFWVLGCICYICGIYSNNSLMTKAGSYVSFMAWYGEMFFHVLTCVERYVAVVHPITYLNLRNTCGLRIRNVSVGCVWVLCVGQTVATALLPLNYNNVILFFSFPLSLIIISFCSLSVLCALIRSGPGGRGGEKERVDQSKQRLFTTITAITCAVWLWFVGLLVCNALSASPQLSDTVKCAILASVSWLTLPSCLVLPLLYLHRAGRIPCCCFNNQ